MIELTYKNGHPMCWLTWIERENGLVELRAVSLTKKHAGYTRAAMNDEAKRWDSGLLNIVRVWTEEREAEHFFGAAMNEQAVANIGKVMPRKQPSKGGGDER